MCNLSIKMNQGDSSERSSLLTYTERLDVEECVVEERVVVKHRAWKHKNIPAWPKNVSFFVIFGPLQPAMHVIRTW